MPLAAPMCELLLIVLRLCLHLKSMKMYVIGWNRMFMVLMLTSR